MKKSIKVAIVTMIGMHISIQAMLLNRLQTLSQRRSLQRPQARFTFKPQNNFSPITSVDRDDQLQPTKKNVNPFDLNKKIDNKLNEQQNTSGWSFYGFLSQLGIVKPTFTAHYRKENRIIYTQEELLEKLEQLSNLSYGKEHLLQENYRHEMDYGDEKQARAWLLGERYKEAARNITTVGEIELIYEAIVMWFRLQAQAGLLITPEQVRVELNKLAPKESEIINTYDIPSKAVLHRYLSEMKNDLYNEFRQWLGSRFVNVKRIQQAEAGTNKKPFAHDKVNAVKKNQQQVAE